MKLKRGFKTMVFSSLLAAMCVTQASALEFGFSGADDYLFAEPTSQTAIYREEEDVNVNRSKTAALMPPGFGTPTSYVPNSGSYLTPNLAPGGMSGGLVNSLGSVDYTTVPGVDSTPLPSAGSVTMSTIPNIPDSTDEISVPGGDDVSWSVEDTDTDTVGFTGVTDDLYYEGGHLGTLSIPSINLNVKIFEGANSNGMAKGVGHFAETSIWAGNVCLAGHNRGVNTYFGKIHTLKEGDVINLTTKLGTRSYGVTSVEKISASDTSATASSSDNRITLYTCVRNQSAYRWCVTAVEEFG